MLTRFKQVFGSLLILTLGSSSPSLFAADIDYAADLSGRTYSSGLSLEPAIGLHQLVWGDPTTPFFGYIRPAVSASLSPTLMSGKASLDIYPLSFLGMSLARNWSHRFLEATGYDCDANDCLGRLDDTELTFKLLSAYHSYFAALQYQRIFYDANRESDQNIMDPSNALIYRADGSNLNSWNIIVGKKVSKDIGTGFIMQRGDLDRRISASEADYLFVRSSLEPYGFTQLSATLGLGRFNSDVKRPGLSLIAVLSYTGKPQLGPAL